jgi:hypothetical protein
MLFSLCCGRVEKNSPFPMLKNVVKKPFRLGYLCWKITVVYGGGNLKLSHDTRALIERDAISLSVVIG